MLIRAFLVVSAAFLVCLSICEGLETEKITTYDATTTSTISEPVEVQMPKPGKSENDKPHHKSHRFRSWGHAEAFKAGGKRGGMHGSMISGRVGSSSSSSSSISSDSSAEGSMIITGHARLHHIHTDGVVCGNVTCGHHEFCAHSKKDGKPFCFRKKFGRRPGHSRKWKTAHSFSKLDGNWTDTRPDARKRVHKLRLDTREFQDQHRQKFKISTMTTDNYTKLRSKKFVDDNDLENNTSDKWNKDCRRRELDFVGVRLLDQFKMNQDRDLNRQKATNKRRKEKRNSTKKELHEDDECICQAPVSWQFQHLDVDTDGHLSRVELQNLTSESACVLHFVSACDHDNDANLSEKEWCCCFADILPPCLASLKNVPSILVRGQPMVAIGAFVPRCDDDGFYSRVQCHSSTGQCWCVDRNGKRIGDMTRGTPDCGAKSDAPTSKKITPSTNKP